MENHHGVSNQIVDHHEFILITSGTWEERYAKRTRDSEKTHWIKLAHKKKIKKRKKPSQVNLQISLTKLSMNPKTPSTQSYSEQSLKKSAQLRRITEHG